jgi:hypothetical protein
MVFFIKIIAGFIFYDFVFKPLCRAFFIVLLRHSKKAQKIYFRLVHKFIDWGYIKLDEGEEYERRQRIKVGDLIFVKSAEFGNEVTRCTEQDKETMSFKLSDRYFKILGYAERRE